MTVPAWVRLSEGLGAGSQWRCSCLTCIRKRGDIVYGLPREMTEMIVCPVCGDKRCVHAKDHEAPCAKTDIYAHNAWIERHLLFARLEAPNVEVTCP